MATEPDVIARARKALRDKDAAYANGYPQSPLLDNLAATVAELITSHEYYRSVARPRFGAEHDSERPLATPPTDDERWEYRAWIRRPWSILDPEKYQARGWMESSVVLKRQEDVKNVYEIKRSEESRAYVHRWERRHLTEGAWEAME